LEAKDGDTQSKKIPEKEEVLWREHDWMGDTRTCNDRRASNGISA